ncbi:NADP-dependent oxidoreductase [Pseudonocardia ailaonensis]|uniref:NADP-dependent oxidoreductase n=1 Tax=Pseudonocardia ailaonensis TaxID=367279 RepID=A0ABN2N610_9PSEU
MRKRIMRAYGFTDTGGPDREAFLEVPVPEPGPGELRVRVRAAGVNPGDWRLRQGFYGAVGRAVLGREVAGTVTAVGEGITRFAVGDEVFGGCPGMVGGFAPEAVVTASFCAHRPTGVSPENAAVLPVAAGTAWDALNQLDLPEGSTLLVNGAGGGVGIPTVQLARARGLRVIGTASPAKHDDLIRFGAIPVAYDDDVLNRIHAAAPGGIDAVLNMAGRKALRTVAPLVADPARHLRSVSNWDLVAQLGGTNVTRDRSTAVLEQLGHLVAAGALDPLVTDVRPFDDAHAALRLVEDGHSLGKVVLAIDS